MTDWSSNTGVTYREIAKKISSLTGAKTVVVGFAPSSKGDKFQVIRAWANGRVASISFASQWMDESLDDFCWEVIYELVHMLVADDCRKAQTPRRDQLDEAQVEDLFYYVRS